MFVQVGGQRVRLQRNSATESNLALLSAESEVIDGFGFLPECTEH